MGHAVHEPAESLMIKDLTGQTFGRYVVLAHAGQVRTNSRWLCRCECGTEKRVTGSDLTCGKIKSCGCLRQEQLKTHGKSRTPTYKSWLKMKERCYNPNQDGYEYYGGRGIEICDAWRFSFEQFLADMGERIDRALTLDRVNPDGNYEPENCRWATAKEQAGNKR